MIHEDDLSNISTEELERELNKRTDRNYGRCSTCGGKWPLYMGSSSSWRQELHCFGCRRPQSQCQCSH